MYKENESDRITTQRTLTNTAKALKARLLTYGDDTADRHLNTFLKMQGLAVENFEFLQTVDELVGRGTKINDISIDDNANKQGKHIGSAVQEAIAPVKKAIGFDYLYRTMKELYGQEEATRLNGKMLDYTIALSDASSIYLNYCWSFNASLFVVGGKNFGGYRAEPPETVGDYIGGMCEIVHEFASNLAGALAIGTLFFDLAHILLTREKVDLRELRSSTWLRKSLKSEFSQLIRSCNNLSRNGIESPFTNVSLFDRVKLRQMLEDFGWYFLPENLPISAPESIENEEARKGYYLDFLCEYVMELQDIYLDVFDAGDPTRGKAPLKFPVTTANLSKSKEDDPKILDSLFLRDICNREIFRYNLFASTGTKVASCCFRGDQQITAGLDCDHAVFDGYSLSKLYAMTHDESGNKTSDVMVPGEGRFLTAEVIKIEYVKPFIAIQLNDGLKLVTTDNHKNAYQLSEDFYADIESWEVKPGIILATDKTSINPAGLEVMEVNKNIPNPEKVAYCLRIVDKDATHFNLPNGIITHNCRLINDIEMMDYASQANSFGAGGGVSLGSHRVATQNTVRLALLAESRNDFYRLLAENMEDSAKILKAHKTLLVELEKRGCQPFITAGWIDLKRSFSTFGIIGVYETAEIFRSKFGNNEDTEGNLLRFINTQMELVSKKYDIIGNIEQIPAEAMAVRLCKADKLLFPGHPYLKDLQLYSNQFIPLTTPGYSVYDRMDCDGRYNRLVTGGGIVHITIGEKVTPTQAAGLIKYAVKVGAEHFALNATFSRCVNDHTHFGKQETCPQCGADIATYITRVIGYYSEVENWNPTRRTEDFPNRDSYGKSDIKG